MSAMMGVLGRRGVLCLRAAPRGAVVAPRPVVGWLRAASFSTEVPFRREEEATTAAPKRGLSSTAVQVSSAEQDTALPTGYQYLSLYRNTIGDKSQRTIHYAITGSTRFVYAAAIRVFILKLLYTWTASADVMAMSTVEYNLENLAPGDATTIKWRGKPVFIRHLTESEVNSVQAQDLGELRDVESHDERVQNPEWSVILGICTHLGCVPIHKAGDWGGYFCPCHGSHYDASGRIMKGPAPENMEVPVYSFLDDSTLLIG